MNNHSDISRLLSAYCAGDLPVDERIKVEAHLKECGFCRSAVADLQVTLHLTRTTPEVEPPPWMTERIMAHVREEKARRRGWLKYIFFPLHIKIPLEVMAVLAVCVSGYYLSRTVETELKAPRSLQELPGSPPPGEKPVKRETLTQPAAPPSVTTAPKAPAQKSPDDRPDALQQPMVPSAPAVPQPAFEAERSSAAAGAAAEPATKPVPASGDFKRSLESAPEMRKKAIKGAPRQESESVAPVSAGQAASDSSGKYIPQLLLRLTVADASRAAEDIRAVAISSGAIVTEESGPVAGRVRMRIPAARFAELTERLDRIGRLSDHPKPQGASVVLDVTIQW